MREENVAEKEKPADGAAGFSKNIGESGDSSFTKYSSDRQSENGPVAKMRWLDRVASDEHLPASATRVAFAIAAHINARSGIAWPSVERIGDLLKLNPRSVRRCISALVSGGYLAVEFGGGSVSSKYTLLHDDDHIEMVNRTTEADQGVAPRTELSLGDEATPDRIVPTPGHFCPGTPDRIVPTPRTKMSGELSENNSLKEPSEGTHSLREGEIIPFVRGEDRKPAKRGQQVIPLDGGSGKRDPEGFAEFWLVYPKKAGQFEAAEAFREAIKHADAGEIIAGAQRYAEARRAAEHDPVQRERFTASAEKWLRGRRWRDEHAAPRPPGVGKHFAAALADLGADLA